jgi:predicted phage tail component-like protein
MEAIIKRSDWLRNGFKFKDRHSSEFGVTVKTKSRPIRPEAKTYMLDLPMRDGAYDLSAANEGGREYYYDRTFTMVLNVCADSLRELQNKLSSLSGWLSGSGDLIFDDMPETVWYGKISDEIIYAPERGGKCAALEVSIRVKPFAKCIFGTEGPVLDTELPIDSGIALIFEELMRFTVTGSAVLKVHNFGERPIRPKVTIENGGSVIMELGEKRLSFDSGGSCIVDFEERSVTANGENIAVSGEFFELSSGENSVRFENSDSEEVTVEFSYTPEFNYGVNPDAIDWGDDDA